MKKRLETTDQQQTMVSTCLCVYFVKNHWEMIRWNYSGFSFSHYDLPFPTRYYITYVRSGLYQLVIRVKGFRVSAHDLDTHFFIRFCPSACTPRFQRESSCVSLVHGSRWLFLVSRHRSFSAAANQKPFVNKDLCTRKSVKRTIKVVRAKRLASAWQLKCQAVLVGS